MALEEISIDFSLGRNQLQFSLGEISFDFGLGRNQPQFPPEEISLDFCLGIKSASVLATTHVAEFGLERRWL